MSATMSDVLSRAAQAADAAEGVRSTAKTEALLELLALQQPADTGSNSVAAVTTGGVTVLAAASAGTNRKRVVLQNLGTVVVWVRLAASPSNTGANGEIALKAGTGANDGTGGVLDLGSYNGIVTAATASSTANVSVAVMT